MSVKHEDPPPPPLSVMLPVKMKEEVETPPLLAPPTSSKLPVIPSGADYSLPTPPLPKPKGGNHGTCLLFAVLSPICQYPPMYCTNASIYVLADNPQNKLFLVIFIVLL